MAQQELAQVDLYQILEVPPAARTEEVRRAYFRLAKRFHPDHREGGDQEATERFIAIQQAYKILTSPIEREKYDALRRKGKPAEQPAPAPGEPAPMGRRAAAKEQDKDARRAYLHAQQLIEQGDAGRAVEILRVLVKTVPDNLAYQSLYGYALSIKGRKLHTARDLCRRAVEAEPYNSDFHAHLGCVYVRAGLGRTAQSCFEEALRWDPNHPLALRHLKPAESAPAAGLGWLRNLLGRKK
jgi:curved DNA-binding protein CbpA